MSRYRRSRSSLFIVAVACAVVASGCVKPKDPGVATEKIQARLVFGVSEEKPPPPAPTQALQAAIIEEPEVELLELNFEEDFEPPVRKPREACPKAPPGAPIKDESPPSIKGTPKEGLYTWRVVLRRNQTDGRLVTVRDTFVQRAIRRVNQVTPTQFTFETLEPGPDDTTIVSTYLVKQDPPPVNPPTPPVEPVKPPRTGDPERGLVLKKQVVLDEHGNESAAHRPFDPAYGLLILPLPAVASENFQATSTDRRSGDTYFADTTVQTTKVHDACGELLLGWHVHASQTLTRPDDPQGIYQNSNPQIDYIVATNMGGMIVWQETVAAGASGTNEYLTVGLASLTPQPLPDALK